MAASAFTLLFNNQLKVQRLSGICTFLDFVISARCFQLHPEPTGLHIDRRLEMRPTFRGVRYYRISRVLRATILRSESRLIFIITRCPVKPPSGR